MLPPLKTCDDVESWLAAQDVPPFWGDGAGRSVTNSYCPSLYRIPLDDVSSQAASLQTNWNSFVQAQQSQASMADRMEIWYRLKEDMEYWQDLLEWYAIVGPSAAGLTAEMAAMLETARQIAGNMGASQPAGRVWTRVWRHTGRVGQFGGIGDNTESHIDLPNDPWNIQKNWQDGWTSEQTPNYSAVEQNFLTGSLEAYNIICNNLYLLAYGLQSLVLDRREEFEIGDPGYLGPQGHIAVAKHDDHSFPVGGDIWSWEGWFDLLEVKAELAAPYDRVYLAKIMHTRDSPTGFPAPVTGFVEFRIPAGRTNAVVNIHASTHTDWLRVLNGGTLVAGHIPSAVNSQEPLAAVFPWGVEGKYVEPWHDWLTPRKETFEIGPLVPIELKIWNGQDAADPVPEDKKYSVGAFTVANLNDTDGNGTIDKDQTGGVTGEKDLMKLHTGGYKGMPGKVKLTVKTGKDRVKFWADKEKKTPIALDAEGAVFFDIPADGLDKDLWIEATAASAAVRDIEIWEGYQPTGGALQDGKDKVKATAVWSQVKTFANQAAQGLWADVQDPMKQVFTLGYGAFGKSLNNPQGHIAYVIGFEWEVQPKGVGNEPSVMFDLSRQRQKRVWGVGTQGLQLAEPPEDFPNADLANDDNNTDDESVKVTNDHIYSFDGPGLPFRTNTFGADQIIMRQNFNEFARVSFNGKRPDLHLDLTQNKTVGSEEGSRCSDKSPWHSFLWLEAPANGTYSERQGKQNDVDWNHNPVAPDPVP